MWCLGSGKYNSITMCSVHYRILLYADGLFHYRPFCFTFSLMQLAVKDSGSYCGQRHALFDKCLIACCATSKACLKGFPHRCFLPRLSLYGFPVQGKHLVSIKNLAVHFSLCTYIKLMQWSFLIGKTTQLRTHLLRIPVQLHAINQQLVTLHGRKPCKSLNKNLSGENITKK